MMSYNGICFGGHLDGQGYTNERPIFIVEKPNGFRETYFYESMAAQKGTLTGIWRHESLDLGQVVAHALLAYQQKTLRSGEAIVVKPETLRRMRDLRDRWGSAVYTPPSPGEHDAFLGIPIRIIP